MEYMKIGKSDVEASIITLGAWAIGGGDWWKGSEDELSIQTIQRSLELGINTIDTAPIYGCGHSEGDRRARHRGASRRVRAVHEGHLRLGYRRRPLLERRRRP